jgi:small subunit ribosomal protein S2
LTFVATPTLQELLEAGTHFGHQTRRWNPKMRKFIFAERSGIYLIDLQKTLKQLNSAAELLKGVAMRGENVLFVCTKRQLKAVVEAEARNAGAHWVNARWHAHELPDHQEADSSPPRPRAGCRRGRLRELHQEGAAPLLA